MFTFAERIQHISQRLTLTARRSALLKGDPWNIIFHLILQYKIKLQITKNVHTFKTDILGKF